MKVYTCLFMLAFTTVISSALKVNFRQARRSAFQRRSGGDKFSVHQPAVLAASATDLNLNDVHDLIYLTDVTVGGTPYPVQLDTGSSDLWIQGPSTPLPNANQTASTYNLTYGIGWAFGHVSYASVQFAGITVASQALLDVSSARNPALSYGADGILGLGFTSLSSIDAFLNSSNTSTGRSLLYNLFQDNPKEPNFISFSLQRSTDPGDEVQGSFSIGEYEPAYAAVAEKIAIPTWPVHSPARWNVLLDAVILGNTTVTPTTSVANAPSNKAVVLLDSGTSYTYAPQAICDVIYGNISGARYDGNLSQWIVPCSTEIDMALQIGGQVFPIHPLDVNPVSLTDNSTCVGSFVPQTVSVGSGQFDWLVGDNFLRSVYSIYDFGDFDSSGNMGNPYIKLLSLIDPNEASADFHKIRGGTANTNITYNASNNTSSEPASTVSMSTQVTNTLDKIRQYFPVMLGIIALNALVLIALVILGIVILCRGRRVQVPKRTVRGRSPMPMNPRNSFIGSILPPQPHAYQPVSMALTEDTMFTPPAHNFEGSTLRQENRPKSMLPKANEPVSVALSDDTMLVPPSPGFRKFEGGTPRPGDRPRSMQPFPYDSASVAGTDDAILTPPSPGFRKFEGGTLQPGDRPRSMQPSPYDSASVAVTDDVILMPPSPGFHNSRDRPKSVA